MRFIETETKYICCKCRKKIRKNVNPSVASMYEFCIGNDGDKRMYDWSPKQKFCLCRKCTKDTLAFLNNKVPHQSSEREQALTEKLEKQTSDYLFGLNIIRDYSRVMDNLIHAVFNGLNEETFPCEDDEKTQIKKYARLGDVENALEHIRKELEVTRILLNGRKE